MGNGVISLLKRELVLIASVLPRKTITIISTGRARSVSSIHLVRLCCSWRRALTEDMDLAAKSYAVAVTEAVLVTVLWSSSWVIIKYGLTDIPPLTFSGLRYSLAAVILLAIILSRAEYRDSLHRRGWRWWRLMAVYGTVFVAITQGSQFVALGLLPAITVSMYLNLTPIIVLVLGVLYLKEVPSSRQVCLILLAVFGAMLYIYPADLSGSETVGLVVIMVGLVANAFSSVMGRSINRTRVVSPVVVTGISMTAGAVLLLAAGFIVEGIVPLSPQSVFYVVWLSVVNTAFAFTLWNRAMQTLRAVDMSILNSTMMPQIVILSIWFLGEMPSLLDWVGLAVLAISVSLVQVIQAREVARKR